MERIELFSLEPEAQTFWKEKIREKDWPAARSLANYLDTNTFLERSKGKARIFLLTDGEELISFCTVANQDDVDSDLFPWIGYVYTDPRYRSHHYGFSLLHSVMDTLKEEGIDKVYISSGHQNLYQKLGFSKQGEATTRKGELTNIFVKSLREDL